MDIELNQWNTLDITSKFIDNYSKELHDKKIVIYKKFISSKQRRLVDFNYSLELLP
jgi:hypothetical protein